MSPEQIADSLTEAPLIYPGDPRHPCDICSGRNVDAVHCAPCPPVPDFSGVDSTWPDDLSEALTLLGLKSGILEQRREIVK